MKYVHYGTNGKKNYKEGKTTIPTGDISGYVQEHQDAIKAQKINSVIRKQATQPPSSHSKTKINTLHIKKKPLDEKTLRHDPNLLFSPRSSGQGAPSTATQSHKRVTSPRGSSQRR